MWTVAVSPGLVSLTSAMVPNRSTGDAPDRAIVGPSAAVGDPGVATPAGAEL
jgi:hypothetical protein